MLKEKTLTAETRVERLDQILRNAESRCVRRLRKYDIADPLCQQALDQWNSLADRSRSVSHDSREQDIKLGMRKAQIYRDTGIPELLSHALDLAHQMLYEAQLNNQLGIQSNIESTMQVWIDELRASGGDWAPNEDFMSL